MTLVELLNVILAERRLVAAVAALVVSVVIATVLLQSRTYASRMTFMPESDVAGGMHTASRIAAQFGLGQAGAGGRSPAFYAALLRSRPILEQAVENLYTVRTDTGTVQVSLIDVYEGDSGHSHARRLARSIYKLDQHLRVRIIPDVGIVEVTVLGTDPDLAHGIARKLLDLVMNSDIELRQTRASREREFISGRLAQAQIELREAESELQTFLLENRQFRSSPELQFQYDRLQRAVAMRQATYSMLADAHEQARIQEVRSMPGITVLAPPSLPVIPQRRGLVMKTVLGLFAGLLLGVLAALAREQMNRTRDQDAVAFERFRSLRSETVEELLRPISALRRGRKTSRT